MKIIFITVIAFIVFMIFDICLMQVNTQKGVVVDKQYKPETTSVGTGVSNGKTVTTVQTDSEEWLIMARCTDGEIVTIKAENNIYYSKNVGDQIKFNVCTGKFTGWLYEINAK